MSEALLSPSTSVMRLLSVSVAALAALALVVLGVMIGTDGLGILGERKPASVTLSPTAALVDVPRARPATPNADLRATLLSLLPPGVLDVSAADAPAALPAPAVTPAAPAAAAPPIETAPPEAPTPEPAPAPAPTDALPAPVPSPVPVPVPAPIEAPVAEPVAGTVDQLVETVTGTLGL